MRFLRRRSNHTIVALLAVAMQAALALSYGHIHAHGHLPGGTQAWAKSVAAMACRAMVRPAGCPKPSPHDEAECAACWYSAQHSRSDAHHSPRRSALPARMFYKLQVFHRI